MIHHAFPGDAGDQCSTLPFSSHVHAVAGSKRDSAFHYIPELETYDIPCGPDGQTTIRVIRPSTAKPDARLPVVVYFNWSWRNRNTTSEGDRFVSEFASGAQVVVVCIDQNNPLEYPMEHAVESAYAATQWIASNGAILQVDTSKLGIAAAECGSAVMAAVRKLAVQRKGPSILFEIAI